MNELACAFNVHRAVWPEDAENEAARSKGARVEEIVTHEGKLVVGIEEVSASRPQEDMHREAAALNRCAYQTVAWREAAFAECCAKFDAIRSPFAGGEASLDALCTKFEDNLAH
jgi:predicted outer membrane lipoprotein